MEKHEEMYRKIMKKINKIIKEHSYERLPITPKDEWLIREKLIDLHKAYKDYDGFKVFVFDNELFETSIGYMIHRNSDIVEVFLLPQHQKFIVFHLHYNHFYSMLNAFNSIKKSLDKIEPTTEMKLDEMIKKHNGCIKLNKE
jgi:hypothetical protein